MKKILLVLSLLLVPLCSLAQYNEQNYKQVKSMETGPWDFAPDWYYYWMHKSYSGAGSYIKWKLIVPTWRVRFKEERSKVKRVLPVREKEAAVQLLKKNEIEEERKQIKEMHDEEVKRSLERNVDLVYSSYKDDFLRLNKRLRDGFNIILKESKNQLAAEVTRLTREQNVINERIAYAHRTGVGYEMENAKREQLYIAAKKDLEKLLTRTLRLAVTADLLY